MEKLAYLIKHRFPVLFRLVEGLAQRVTVMRFGRRIQFALDIAMIEGAIRGRPACISVLTGGDADRLCSFLHTLPAEHLQYFRPHGFELPAVRRVLMSQAFLNYGLFVDDELRGYALLKIAPTGTAFIGLLVHPEFVGLGLGTFIIKFLYWQASLAGLRARSTISRHNIASLRSHQAVADYKVVSELPNDYLLVEFPAGNPEKPLLSAS